jgi:DNA mismatch endonuclease (patch repair protein)
LPCSRPRAKKEVPDRFTPEQRSRVMSRVKGRDTRPERIVRSLLHRMGYRFRLHRKDLPGKPDVVLPRHRKVVFVHGCFWHGHEGCRRATRPKTRPEFWNRKIDSNMERDARAQRELEAMGWDVLVVWQCETRDEAALTERLRNFLDGEEE